MDISCDFQPRFCKNTYYSALKEKFDNIVRQYNSYIRALMEFDVITENNIRIGFGNAFSGRSGSQRWKSCKGSLYEYAVCRAIQEMIDRIHELRQNVKIIHGLKLDSNEYRAYANQIIIRDWSDILPDTDFIVVDSNNIVRAIISCKTSLRERLTETAFWKMEHKDRNIEYIFITTGTNREITLDTNRYIIMHILDYTIITEQNNLEGIIRIWKNKYGTHNDFEKLIFKIGGIVKLCEVLCNYINNEEERNKCKNKCLQFGHS